MCLSIQVYPAIDHATENLSGNQQSQQMTKEICEVKRTRAPKVMEDLDIM